MKKIYVLLLTFITLGLHAQIEYTGDNLLMVVGKTKTSYDFKEFKTYWLLDSKLESNYGGIKILINTATQTADTLLIAGTGFTLGETKFYPYSAKLPWGIKIKDKYSDITAKTSPGTKTPQGYLFEFVGYSMLVNYNTDLQIRWIKIYTNQKQPDSKQAPKPVVAELPKPEPVKVIPPAEKPVEVKKETQPVVETPKPEPVKITPPVEKQVEVKKETQPVTPAEPRKAVVIEEPLKKAEETKKEEVVTDVRVVKPEAPKPVETKKEEPKKPGPPVVAKVEEPKKEEPKPVVKEEPKPVKVEEVKPEPVKDVAPVKAEAKKDTVKLINKTPFQMAILNVFYAYDESSFESVKGAKMDTANFWSYQFAFKSKLKIPGEKYSIVYCYPTATSSEDFITVIKEGNFDGSFGAAYSDMEMRLRQNLTISEGWKAVNLPSNGKPLNPIEFKHSKHGSVILDYARNAKNQHLLFLRYTFPED